MEKYSQYRDRGSGIAPFFPVPTAPAGLYLPFYTFLFVVRVTILVFVAFAYFFIFTWLPLGGWGTKGAMWCMLGAPGIWWIDLQIDRVRRGSLAQHYQTRLPQPGTVIASSFTSPIDALYLAAIFDPIFTASYPDIRLVQQISLPQAVLRALFAPQAKPPPNARLVDLATLIRNNPDRCIAVFPECTTTNGRGILQFSPSLLTAPSETKIFPVSLRYSPADITTPIPGTYLSFLWNLCSKPTHCIRVRIAEAAYNTSGAKDTALKSVQPLPEAKNSYSTNFLDKLQTGDHSSSTDTLAEGEGEDGSATEEQKVLVKIAEALARLGRVKRVSLGIKEKADFVAAWKKKRS